MNADPHWNLLDLAIRLDALARTDTHHPRGRMEQEAASAIRVLIATNKDLNRRAQKVESDQSQENHLARELAKERRESEHRRAWALQSFNRMGAAFDEIKTIYNHLRRAYDDGCDGYGYHSVNDMPFGGKFVAGAVWANVYKSRQGGVVTVRPAEIVGSLIDELIAFRKFFQKPGRR